MGIRNTEVLWQRELAGSRTGLAGTANCGGLEIAQRGATGHMLSRYKVLGKLGAGGMGVVYRAEDLTLKRPVALKVITGALHEDAHARARFLREARTAAGLNHPNVCTIHDFGEVQPGEEEALGSGERFQGWNTVHLDGAGGGPNACGAEAVPLA